MRIELSCSACGQNRFSFPEGTGDDAIVTCADCGRPVGTLGQLKERVAETVLNRAWARDAGQIEPDDAA